MIVRVTKNQKNHTFISTQVLLTINSQSIKGCLTKCGGFDPREAGDYPDFYCNTCFDLKFKKYDQEYLDIENEHSNKLELLEQKIREESLEL